MKRGNTESSLETKIKEWTIRKDVQAYYPNRLMVLYFHGMVLSGEVKKSSYSFVEAVIVWCEYREFCIA